MQIWGKVWGGLIGFFIGRFVGMAIGLFLGHQIDKAQAINSGRFSTSGFGSKTTQAERQEEFLKSAFAVMGHVAKAKGQVTKNEIQLASIMMDRMNLHGEQRLAAQDAFRNGKAADFPLDNVLEKVCIATGRRFDLIQFFLELQISAAFADGDLHPSEREVLHIVAKGLGFSAQQLNKRLQMQEAAFRFQQGAQRSGQQQQRFQEDQQQSSYHNSSFSNHSSSYLSDAYKLLGISEDADDKEIKRAYRKLMNEHHPDKLVAKGLPPEMMEMAKQQTQEIQAAYDLIKKVKQIK